MVDKVRTAFYGKDLRVEIKKYPLNSSGDKIEVVNGGAHHFMPDIGPNTFLDMPVRKKYIFFGPWVYVRTFFAIKRATKCIDFFPQGIVYGPDPEQLKQANMVALAKDIGSEREKSVSWPMYLILIMNMLMIVLLAQVAGIIR